MVPWIKVATDIAHNDGKVNRIAKVCGVNDAEALGLVVGVLTALPLMAPTGDLSDVSDAKIEAAAAWERKRGQFAAAFRSVWCVDNLVANWDRWNGATLREFAAKRERSREYRDRQKTRTVSDTVTETVSDTVRTQYPPKREEGRERTTTLNTQEEVDIPSAPADVKNWVHPSGHDALAALFATVADVRTWVGLFNGWRSGMDMDHNRPCEPERLAVAVRDFVAAGKHLEPTGPSPQLFRGYVKRAKSPQQRKLGQLSELDDRAEFLRTIRRQNERRRRTGQPEKPEPEWAPQIDAMFPDGSTWDIAA